MFKSLKLILVASFIGIFFSPVLYAETEAWEMDIHGISCSFCVYGLEKNMKKIDGVESIDVDVNVGKAWVKFDGKKGLNEEAVQEAVQDAGLEYKGYQVIKPENIVSES